MMKKNVKDPFKFLHSNETTEYHKVIIYEKQSEMNNKNTEGTLFNFVVAGVKDSIFIKCSLCKKIHSLRLFVYH